MGPLDLDPPGDPAAGHDSGKNRRRTIFGAVDLRAGRFLYQVTRKAVSATFTGFCEHLLAAYSGAPVGVICDNVIIHRSKIVQRRPATHPRLLVLHGARYRPHDNPAERIWSAQGVAGQQSHPTIWGRVRHVHAFFPTVHHHPAADHRRAT